MSKIHVLEGNNRRYKVIIHTATPSGSNSATKAWKDVLLASGESGDSALNIGTKPSNITQAESDSITTGDTLEFSTTILLESSGATAESINAMVDKFATGEKKRLQNKYKYYGKTVG